MSTNPVIEHLLIKADNKEFLSTQLETNSLDLLGKVDTCYIDPPYNTGNRSGFTYNDKFDADEWIKMMRDVLTPLKRILKPTGVVLVSIDDSEIARLRLLMEDIFGRNNFIAQLVVDGGANKNNSNFFSITHEYILVFGKDLKALNRSGVKWRKHRDGVDVLLSKRDELLDSGLTQEEITTYLKTWVKTQSLSPRLRMFYNSEPRGLYTYADLSTPSTRYEYQVHHPKTDKPVALPSRGWGISQEKFEELIRDDMIIWKDDETSQPLKKIFLKDEADQLMRGVVEYPARASTHLLEKLLGRRTGFTNPKNLNLMKDLIKYTTPSDGVILDYFGGSGSTLHAVIELNDTDRSTRRGILVTNNENNIFDEVTAPRIKKVLLSHPNQIVRTIGDGQKK